ncbi:MULTISPECIES: hypothetical protein [Bradyrhizobium]|uniref:PKD domain-containing protein n=1 Tax=Bradyrhizobium elkanii TaxID=29448 RepID=A0A4U6RVI6_BRAEL|nr:MULTISPECIES: hypothetical protein [Bradyrhizobium]MTV15648.1 hypothetical protein [Bradyrhizobium sp. BR2003]TKV79147.1 hypothetical protein FDV58_23670 [Bradyrhizobium elkanii]
MTWRSPLFAIAAIVLGVIDMTATTQMNATSALVASPVSGAAPLEVTFSGTGPGIPEGVVVLEFGDGSIDDTISSIRGFTRTHIYRAAGSYMAVLRSGAYGGQRPAVLSEIARVTILVR